MTAEVTEHPFLSIKGLDFAYGEVKVLYDLDFEIPQNSISCLMGRNGVGKTTLLRNLVGLEKPNAGNHSFKWERNYQY